MERFTASGVMDQGARATRLMLSPTPQEDARVFKQGWAKLLEVAGIQVGPGGMKLAGGGYASSVDACFAALGAPLCVGLKTVGDLRDKLAERRTAKSLSKPERVNFINEASQGSIMKNIDFTNFPVQMTQVVDRAKNSPGYVLYASEAEGTHALVHQEQGGGVRMSAFDAGGLAISFCVRNQGDGSFDAERDMQGPEGHVWEAISKASRWSHGRRSPGSGRIGWSSSKRCRW